VGGHTGILAEGTVVGQYQSWWTWKNGSGNWFLPPAAKIIATISMIENHQILVL
jgi:hypothetical protein